MDWGVIIYLSEYVKRERILEGKQIDTDNWKAS